MLILCYFLQAGGEDITLDNGYTFADLRKAVSRNDVIRIKEIVKENPKVIAHKADCEFQILHFACHSDIRPSIVEELILLGADVDACDSDGQTPLTQTTFFNPEISEKMLPIAKTLLASGASVDGTLNYPRPTDGQLKPPFVRSPLAKAAKQCDWKFVDLVLKNGADANRPYTYGKYSPLHYACRPWIDEKTLIKYGNPGNEKVLRLLIQYGADTEAKDLEGFTPDARARDEERQDVLDALERIKQNPDPPLQPKPKTEQQPES